MRFQNKTAVITGGAKGIGEGTAIAFAKEGANLVLLDVDTERLKQTKAECEELGAKVLTFTVDITNEEAVNKVAEEVYKTFDAVDIVANVAGVWIHRPDELFNPEEKSFLTNCKDELWERFWSINMMGTVHVTRAFLPRMMERQYGKIVNVSSVAGINGIPTYTAYSATKGALISFTKSLAVELAPYHINVNCVSPGSISTEGRFAPPSFLGISYPNQQADAILFLASDESNFITGQNLAVDGGRTLSMKCN